MKETDFIDQNKEKWSRFEKLYADSSHQPEELSDLYMDLTDDLSYAQTFYKRRTVRVYLNQLAQMVFAGVNKHRGESLRKFFMVWKTSLPLEIYRSRKSLLFALVVFLIYAAIGALTTHFNPDFPRIVMGDGYVNMTLENIKAGNPLGVYETNDQVSMFILITSNNLKVALMCFGAGLFFTIGTHLLLFSNGVMLGAFQYFFHLKGLLITSFLGIWIHGAFEISAIVLAGGAGITAGNGLLFPGSYTRLQSFQLSVKRGLKIMMSLVPFIITAGFLESYVTHHYDDLPDWSKWTLILFSFALILFVYVFYPVYVARKNPHLVHEEDTSIFSEKIQIQLHKIRPVSEVIVDSFHLYRRVIGKVIQLILPVFFPLLVLIIYFQGIEHEYAMGFQHLYDWVVQLRIIFGYSLSGWQDLAVVFLWSLLLTQLFLTVFYVIAREHKMTISTSYYAYLRKNFVGVWAGLFLLFWSVFLLPWYVLLGSVFLLPLVYLQPAVMHFDATPFAERLKKSFAISSRNYGKSLLSVLMTIAVVAILTQPIAFVGSIHEPFNDKPVVRDLLDLLADFTKRISQIYGWEYMHTANVVRQVVYLTLALLILPFTAITMVVLYFSDKERMEAISLKESFTKFGKRSRIQETRNDEDQLIK